MNDQVPEYTWDPASLQQESTSSVDIREYLQMVLKFKWGILSIAFLAGLMGLYNAYKAVPIYRSTTILQIEKQDVNQLSMPFMWGYDAKFYETQYELIRSWGVAELAAKKLDLLDADHLEGEKKPPAEPGFSWRSLMPEFLKNKK